MKTIFDAHFHIVDPRHPLVPNQGFTPEPFTAQDYLRRVDRLGVTGGAIVSGSFQAFDQGYLVDALTTLGPSYDGVTQLPGDVEDDTVLALDRAGVRAVRFNLYRGGGAGLGELESLAVRVHRVAGWHSELYVDAADLAELEPLLGRLPQVSVDHLGMTDDQSGALLRLVERGLVVKATGFGRMSVTDPARLMRDIVSAHPHGLVVGTDLPSTRARVPFADADLDRVADAVGAEHVADVLGANARRLYRLTAGD